MNEKVAIITGAGSGIGKSTALALSSGGFKIVLAGRQDHTLQETAKEAADPTRVMVVVTDVTDPEAVERLFDKTVQAFGRVDLLFNNAGTNTAPTQFEDLTVNQWQQVVAVNLTGVFLCAQKAFKIMKNQSPQGGRIINNGSISAQVPRPNSAPYTATKHAITGLTKSIALDGRKYHIACGQIDIGNATTAMTDRMEGGVPQADGSLVPEPTMSVNHVAEAVLYMASLPPEANVLSLTVMATNMPYVGRG